MIIIIVIIIRRRAIIIIMIVVIMIVVVITIRKTIIIMIMIIIIIMIIITIIIKVRMRIIRSKNENNKKSPFSEHIVESLCMVCVTVHSIREKYIVHGMFPKIQKNQTINIK